MAIRILMVDDSETFLRGLRSYLVQESDLEIVGMAHSGQEAVAQTRLLLPDVVLMDLRLVWQTKVEPSKEETGLRAIQEVLAARAQARVIVISSRDERRWVVQALDAGARGYLSKDAALDEIIAAIRTVARGGVALSAEQLGWLRGPAEPLTEREREVLALLAQGQGDKEIAQRLGISAGTASKHVENIREKLGASSRGEAVARAREQGLI